MRDNFNNQEIYEKLIEKDNTELEHYKELIQKAIQLNGPDSRGVKNGYIILNTSYQRMVNTMYSAGYAIKEIKGIFKELLVNYVNIWSRESGYIELVKVVSLAVLLGFNSEDIKTLEDRLVEEKFDDCIINFLIKSIDASWGFNGNNYEYSAYECLGDAINSVQVSDDLLKDYLEKKWYKIHKECSWYDIHKKSPELYAGYWSFEAGAVAKILGVDDSSLKDEQYYPYDLVHFIST